MLRKLQTARVPDWASVYVGGLRAFGYRCVAMDYHVSSFHHLPLTSGLRFLLRWLGLGSLKFKSQRLRGDNSIVSCTTVEGSGVWFVEVGFYQSRLLTRSRFAMCGSITPNLWKKFRVGSKMHHYCGNVSRLPEWGGCVLPLRTICCRLPKSLGEGLSVAYLWSHGLSQICLAPLSILSDYSGCKIS